MGSEVPTLLLGLLLILFFLTPGAAIIFLTLGYAGKRARSRPNACLRCDYDLSGLPPDARCPECGRGRLPLWVVDRRFTVIGFVLLALWMLVFFGWCFVWIGMAILGK